MDAVKSFTNNAFIMMAPYALVAAGVVLMLFLLMKTLITKEYQEPGATKTVPLPKIIQENEEIKAERSSREIKEIDDPDEPPPDIPQQEIETEFNVNSPSVNLNTKSTRFVGPKLEKSIVDGDLLPLVAIQPNYPRRAAERGMQGYVIVEFTINTQGSTENIVVVENASGTQGNYKIGGGKVFEKEAIKAAKKLRYKPRVVGGKPVVVTNYPYKFRFELDEK